MRIAPALLGLTLAAAGAVAEPDFDALLDQIDNSLKQAGLGGQPGERIELDRFSPDGWEIRTSAAWDGQAWRVLALRLHHPERVETPNPDWLARYRNLLETLQPEDVEGLEMPELFEVPVPALLPVLPQEIRTRQFMFRDFWYQASWFNEGGPDEYARWSLRSFELVARPASGQ